MQEITAVGQNFPQTGPFSPVSPEQWAAAPYPLGAHYEGRDVTFAVYSKHATRILLEIYDQPTGVEARYDYWLAKNPRDDIWRAKLADIPPGTLYAFRCWGPNWEYDSHWHRGGCPSGYHQDVDDQGNRFNPNKALFDPYARELSHDKESQAMVAAGHSGEMYATGLGEYHGIPRRDFDTGPWVPKGMVLAPDSTSTGQRPCLSPEHAAIYEAHVRGLTQHPTASQLSTLLKNYPGFEQVVDVPVAYRGTYAGAAYMAKYLKALGFTTLELLPVQETANETNPNDQPGGNYWGYMTFGYFAPDRRYAYDKSPGGPTREFKQMVKAFHDEGLEVYLDVVFNHTGEGGNWGSEDTVGFVCFGGFDTREYYQLTDSHYLVDGATGCGNQLNFSNPVTQNLVLDSLTYWLEEMGVDGFRFDLAPVLGRTPDAFEREHWSEQRQFFPRHTLLEQIKQLGDRYCSEMIAEAWDIWGYEVGNFPAGWGEWNGRYRDAVRRFMKGDGNTQTFIEQVNGDYRNFNDQGGPQRSIDFIVAHDGFTLMDLVSYNTKNNLQPWPFGPSDGGNDSNDSWDSGGNQSLRRQRLRNFWTIQMFSRGVPMTVWGDELGRTQNGNNNPYNIDSVATWNNYAMLGTNHPTAVDTGYPGASYHDNFGPGTNTDHRNPLFVFVHYVLHLRNQHPALRQRHYGDLVMDSGGDVTYQFKQFDGQTELMERDRCVWLRIDGSEVGDHDFLLLINMYFEPVTFTVPDDSGAEWRRMIDTAAWAETTHNVWPMDQAEPIVGSYQVHPFAIAVLEEVPQGSPS
ncbi:MAG TPA: glycogen-debranching protein [Leptolyngbyaceae cyanobacterium M65_K2018_010]|nr:glycogen-debranching protein [Leptolyngbyaceae cyanobacterium M65_K2018_010]